MADNNAVTSTPENPIPDVDEIKPTIPNPAWADENEVPIASADNEGQALVSTKKYVKGAVIVPEQTVTFDAQNDDTVELDNVNVSLFTENTVVIITHNGKEYIRTVQIVDDYPEISWIHDTIENYISGDGSTLLYSGAVPSTNVIAVYVAEEAYSWESDPYVGYDVVIKTTKYLVDSSASDLVLVKGSYASCVNRIQNGLPLSALVYAARTGSEDYAESMMYPVIGINGYINYGDEIEIIVLTNWSPYVTVMGTNSQPFNIAGALSRTDCISIILTESGLSID